MPSRFSLRASLAISGLVLLTVSGCTGPKVQAKVPNTVAKASHGHVKTAPTPNSTPFFSNDDAGSDAGVSQHTYFPQQPEGRQISQTIPLDVSGLPIAELPQASTSTTPAGSWPVEIPASTPAPDGVELRPRTDGGYDYGSPYRPVAIHFKDFVLADLRMSGAQWPGGGDLGDALIYCSLQAGYDTASYYGYRVAPVHFEGLERKGDALMYTVIDGWVDSQSCRVRFDHKTSAPVGEIIPGLLYGYLSCVRPAPVTQGNAVSTVVDPYKDPPPPCTDPNRVNLLFPKSTAMASTAGPAANQALLTLSRATLQLRQGMGESVTASIALDEMKKWASTLGLPSDISGSNGRNIELGVEVEQASQDDKTQAVVYIGTPDTNPGRIRVRSTKSKIRSLAF